jgi:hypothetical protein
MRTWKSAFAYLLFAYFVFAGAISLAVQHYSQAALTAATSEQKYNSHRTAGVEARQTALQQRNEPIPTPPPALANIHSIGPGENASDFSQANDIPGSGPKLPNDDYGELMTRALER